MPYFILPIAILIFVLTYTRYNTVAIQPFTHKSVYIFFLLANRPHQIAGLFEFLDTEYLSFYKSRLINAIPILISTAFLLPTIIGIEPVMLLINTWSAVHFSNQQTGILRLFSKIPQETFSHWKATAGLFSCIVMWHYNCHLLFFGSNLNLVIIISAPIILIWLYFTFKTIDDCRDFQCRIYIGAVTASLLVAFSFTLIEMPILTFIVLRIIHDVTAFIFDAIHAHNRNLNKKVNFTYAILNPLKIPIIGYGCILSILISLPISFYESHLWVLSIGNAITLIHLYTEGFIWKRDAYHLRSVPTS